MVKNHLQNWTYIVDKQHVAWLGLDCLDASTNTLNPDVLDELNMLIQKIANDTSLKGMVIYSLKANGFIAGADIHVFSSFEQPEQVRDFLKKGLSVFNRIEQLTIPTIALIDGFCMGGGFELSLACRYRIASERAETKIGLPEVLLGFNPGWGGTVRLPQLIGGFDALSQLMLTGSALPAKKAKELGIVDDVVPVRQLKRAAEFFIQKQPPKHQPSFLQKLSNAEIIRPILSNLMKKKLATKLNPDQYPAPYAMVNMWEKYYDKGQKSYEVETESALNLVFQHPTSSNLIQVFLLKDRLKGFAKEVSYKASHVHVIGAGVMGGDIAAWCALKGITVTIQDQSYSNIAPAIARAKKLFEKRLKKPYLVQRAMDKLIADPQGDGVSRADVIIEAVFEKLDVKQKIFQHLEKHAKPNAILATNTSSIPLDEIMQVMKNPSRLVGIHFFNPVAMMELVEVVHSEHTAQDILEKAYAFIGQIGRLPLPVKSIPGFLVNRVLMPYLLESMTLLDEGVKPEIIDKAAKDFGMMMGPVELADTVGMDVCLAVAKNLTHHFGGAVPRTLQEKVTLGHLGKKSGQGFYRYKAGKAQKNVLPQGTHVPQDIAQRLIMRMVNEASLCLREGVVADADLLDAGMLFGTGFAPFRRGPMHYAKQFGKEQLNELFVQLANQYGERFKKDVTI
ncbi:MAG: crotonase [Gammaproteobacteria bacterium]|nr:crotonase [Gammaproteobacteria bacterium]